MSVAHSRVAGRVGVCCRACQNGYNIKKTSPVSINLQTSGSQLSKLLIKSTVAWFTAGPVHAALAVEAATARARKEVLEGIFAIVNGGSGVRCGAMI